MKVGVEWLRSFGDFDDLSDAQLADKLTMAGLEVEEIHGADSSTVFVTKVTPNRGDWLSVFGVAREASAATSRPLNHRTALAALPRENSIGDFTVEVVDKHLCPRYCASIIKNVEHKPSPAFIQNRLLLAGMRPLNVVVDITNYVMLEIGQPLHAYDQSALVGNKIIVRPAVAGETIKTLDGAKYSLSPDVLVIADATKPIAIAGIMGGAETEVTSATSTIVLETAHFDASIVRRGAKKLGISTEASYRFERFVDPELAPIGIARAMELLAEYAGGVPIDATIDTLSSPIKPITVTLRTTRVNVILGLTLSTHEITHALTRLGLLVRAEHEILFVDIPSFRPDLTSEIDLIEEVGRMIGYENLPETVPNRPGDQVEDFDKGHFDSIIRNLLVGEGLVESYSHTLGSESPFDDPALAKRRVTVRSSLSTELSGLRVSLLPHLLDALALNLRFGAGSVRLFETGKVFYRGVEGGFEEPRRVAAVLSGAGADYATVKGIAENLLDSLNIKQIVFSPTHLHATHAGRTARVTVNGNAIGFVAELDPYLVTETLELPPSTGRVVAFEFDLEALRLLSANSSTQNYVPLPKFPPVTRDVALLYDEDVTFGSIKFAIEESAGEFLESVVLLSVYAGERIPVGKKSVAVRLVFRSRFRTLTESDAEAAVFGVRTNLISKLSAAER
jgi:phenylalanyl-tRNA synthetase beta chain